MTNLEKRNRGLIYHKHFHIAWRSGQYIAKAYSHPTFTNTNLKKLKQQINECLRRH